jgi:hypothetical protein
MLDRCYRAEVLIQYLPGVPSIYCEVPLLLLRHNRVYSKPLTYTTHFYHYIDTIGSGHQGVGRSVTVFQNSKTP